MITLNQIKREFINLAIYTIIILFVILYIIVFFGYNEFIIDKSQAVLGLISLFSCVLLILYSINLIYVLILYYKRKKQIESMQILPENNIIVAEIVSE